ncbi:site-2 protease family protein [Candidatus Giovannonibacteria bacterium]|nr:site-2 protease family protein [Candidatus Giovannonibacteria bacterium]
MAIVTFIAILLVLVLVHEFGHFLLAKLSRVRVEEFAFGFPPRLFSVKRGETRYSFNLLPLGGYVKIQGEEGEDAYDPRSFSSQSLLKKVAIIAAGVFFNFVLAYFLFSAGFMIGTPVPLDDNSENPNAEVIITEIRDGSPADAAGIIPGDKIISFSSGDENILVSKTSEVRNFIDSHKGKEILVKVERSGGELTLNANLPEVSKDGEGVLGIAMIRAGIEKSGLFKALKDGYFATTNLSYLTGNAILGFFGEIFTGRGSFDKVSGPVGIASIVGDSISSGFSSLLWLTGILSISLGIMNIIPFPGLDGGRIFFLLLEKIKGSPFDWKVMRLVHAAGFVLLILLMIFVTYHDILKLTS